MPASKHRKSRRPRPARPCGLPVMFRFSRNAEVNLQLIPHVELSKILDGTATEAAWHTLAFRINVGQAVATLYYADNQALRDAMDAAVIAVAAVGKRFANRGALGVTGDEFRAIGQGLNLTDDMQRTCTRRQLLAATLQAERRATAQGPVAAGQIVHLAEAA
ncbi:conserved hypothetical protein [Cupriavidus taiwanensis]|uniref:hypothetical protein n=1 Tax=Cupriavidus taiwanensis TaxID=164546 RepID=UPI000E197809|nr:hypothetical protein [Cupriavidus taiwanensis]SOZ15559.1 conserved hypothetical protein [Cupriavidus taiwanensis]SOZ27802.1 conserved hypothetical protein [Cupriavidus taiwanensis]SOZ46128.1 conserved hypothetical protein [Cupriavidus taiwanensis]SPA14251.1 conserved hypothetical protein [Cupriavidus taiwanensis]